MTPKVSIILPAFHSEATLAESLRSFCRQDYPEREIIVVDSTPGDACRRIVREQFPGITYFYSPERMLPHAARNKGVTLASGRYFLFSDPDIYPPVDWVRRMVETQQCCGGAIVSPLVCFAPSWLKLGIHFAKFDQLLPRKRVGPVGVGATAGLLCRREDYDRVGGFAGELMLGDTLFSWRLLAAGVPLYLNAGWAAQHHHLSSLGGFMRERFTRGRQFAELVLTQRRPAKFRRGVQILATLLPLRLAKWLTRTGVHAWKAGMFGDFIRVSPVVLSGHAGWLAGEVAGYLAGKKEQS